MIMKGICFGVSLVRVNLPVAYRPLMNPRGNQCDGEARLRLTEIRCVADFSKWDHIAVMLSLSLVELCQIPSRL